MKNIIKALVINVYFKPTTKVSGSYTQTFDISRLDAGVYTYRILSSTGSHSGIITKQ